MGDGSKPDQGLLGKLFDAGKRVLTGESIFMTHFTNCGSGKRKVTFAAPYPGRIIPMDLGVLGGEILCEKDAFVCAAFGTEITVAWQNGDAYEQVLEIYPGHFRARRAQEKVDLLSRSWALR